MRLVFRIIAEKDRDKERGRGEREREGGKDCFAENDPVGWKRKQRRVHFLRNTALLIFQDDFPSYLSMQIRNTNTSRENAIVI